MYVICIECWHLYDILFIILKNIYLTVYNANKNWISPPSPRFSQIFRIKIHLRKIVYIFSLFENFIVFYYFIHIWFLKSTSIGKRNTIFTPVSPSSPQARNPKHFSRKQSKKISLPATFCYHVFNSTCFAVICNSPTIGNLHPILCSPASLHPLPLDHNWLHLIWRQDISEFFIGGGMGGKW